MTPNRSLRTLASIVPLFVLAACGGGDDGPSPALVTAQNAQDLALAAAQGVQQAGGAGSLSLFGGAPTAAGLPAAEGADPDLFICDSGTATLSGESSPAIVNFNACTLGAVLLQGQVELTFDDQLNNLSMDFLNLTATVNGETTPLNGTVFSCSGLNGSSPSCGFVSLAFQGPITMQSYQVSNFSVSGDATTGLSGNGIVNVPGLGTVEFLATQVSFDCPNPAIPDDGSIVITGANGTTAAVNFNGCTTYELCVTETESCENLLWSEFFPSG